LTATTQPKTTISKRQEQSEELMVMAAQGDDDRCGGRGFLTVTRQLYE
jgi:hypothetical protein